jgi:hypothetical protein
MSTQRDTSGSWSYLAEPISGGPVTCAACGCRLVADERTESWFHFSGSSGRDARGCRVDCAHEPHDHRGRRQEVAAA